MKSMPFLASTIAALSHPQMFYAKDDGTSGGGGGAGTLKDQLTAALSKVTALEGDKSQLSTDLETEKGKVTKLDGEKAQLAKDVETEKGKVTKLEGEKTQLATDLTAAQTKIATLEGTAQTATERAREQAAANGHVATPVNPATIAAGTTDGAALHAEYTKLRGRERTAFFRENEKALNAYAKQFEKEPK